MDDPYYIENHGATIWAMPGMKGRMGVDPHTQLTDDAVEINGLRLEPSQHKLLGHGQALAIGPTEFRLLHFFMTHPERVYSRTQLLDQVWGDHVFVEERTVDVHIRRLRLALAPSGHEHLIETVRGAGYRLQGTTSS